MDQAGVFVLGMHRSGTSAVARLVNLLGVPMCVEADLVRAAPSNPRGHWESVSLVRFNDALLHKHGRAWWCPPRLGLVCSGDPSAARELFASVYPTKQWVWKDPRTCLTLSFWLEALNTRPVGILVLRNPLEIAHSLERRDEFYLELSLALWERYMHHGLTALAGLPVAAFQFEELVADPMGAATRLWVFLSACGIEVQQPDRTAIRDFVDPRLRHQVLAPTAASSSPLLSAHQRELASIIDSLPAESPSFAPPELPVESACTDRLFTRLQGDHRLAAPVAPRWQSPAKTSVIVITRSEGPALRRTIRALTQTLPRSTEILVVDDASTDGSTDFLKRDSRVRIITGTAPLGISRARNLGVSSAQGDVLLFSDAHVAPRAEWLPPLLQALEREDVAAAAPTLTDAQTGTVRVHGLEFADAALNVHWLRAHSKRPFPIPLVCGSFVAVRRDALARAGGFDTSFEAYGAEDLELSLRLWRMGYECLAVPAAEVAHAWKERTADSLEWRPFLANLIRLATLHLSLENLAQFNACLSAAEDFPRAYAHVLAGDALRRREELSTLCACDDDWFFARFGMEAFATAKP